MATITVRAELPEGVFVSTRDYQRSHGEPKNEAGNWAFENVETGETIWRTGELLTVVEDLPDGDWLLLP